MICDVPLIDNEVAAADPDRIRSDEAELLRRVRSGDERASAELVREHAGALMACARRFLKNEDDSADVVQETFLSAFRSLDSFQAQSRLGTWLHRIAVNHCLMRLRRGKRAATVSIDELLPTFDESGHHANPVPPWTTRPEDHLTQAETRAQVRACIDRLPDPYRTVVLLRDIEGHDTQDTAKFLGISRDSVKIRLHRARQALRTLLEPIFCEASHQA
jgi:RNA polymerase sigma-70 factor (ECF subfamily)